MPTFEEIIGNEQYPDDTVWTVQDGVQITLGDMRKKVKAYDADYTRKTQQLAEQRKAAEAEIANAYAQLQAAQTEIQQQMQAAQVAQATAAQSQPTQRQELWSWEEPDGYIKPIVQWRRELEEQHLTPLQRRVEELYGAVRDATRWQAQQLLMRDFESLPDKPENFSQEFPSVKEFYEWSIKNGFTDERTKLPNFRRAYERWTEPHRTKQREEKIRQEAYEAARREMTPGLPRAGGMQLPRPQQQKEFKSFDDLWEQEVMRSPEVAESITSLFGNG